VLSPARVSWIILASAGNRLNGGTEPEICCRENRKIRIFFYLHMVLDLFNYILAYVFLFIFIFFYIKKHVLYIQKFKKKYTTCGR
jgi:hypothetical protein